MTPSFDRFVAMDWSGSNARRYNGIAIAVCRPGASAPKLVRPTSGSWSRTAVAEWLNSEIASGARLLVGFDFAFGFPYLPKEGYLGGRAGKVRTIFELWRLIDTLSRDDADFGCAGMVATHLDLFWTAGPRPTGWIQRKRVAEHACGAATRTHPESLYKLLHSKQVGKASMTGIRVLNNVRRRHPGRFAIWPFEAPSQSIAVEIFPTLFREDALGSTAKIRTWSGLNEALAHYGSRAMERANGTLTDHDSDALLSAAALRSLGADHRQWTPPAERRIAREGWIFGVGAA